jgi:Cd2+/Zn2+-exporting ATPase
MAAAEEHAEMGGCCGRGETDTFRLRATVASGVCTGVGLLIHFVAASEIAEKLFFAAGILAGGWYIAPLAWNSVRRLSPDMNLLMSAAVIGAVFIDAWDEAASVVFLFSLSELLESYSIARARRAISSLLTLAPETAIIKNDATLVEVPSRQVKIGDVILIKPGSKVPLDGIVLAGRSSVSEAAITGEPMPVDKMEASPVYAGSMNQEGALEVRVTRLATDSTLARIIHLVEEAQEQKAATQRFVDRFARHYTPGVMVLALLIAVAPPLFRDGNWALWFYRALVLLVIACPCALVISTPVAIVTGLTAAARRGILVKGGSALENLGRLRALALDKTGTLTLGKPVVTEIIGVDATASATLETAAAIESRSEHPLAQAIVKHAADNNLTPNPVVEEFEAIPGRGVTAVLDGQPCFIGNLELAEAMMPLPEKTLASIESLVAKKQTVAIVGHASHEECSGKILGMIAIGDAVRPFAQETMASFRNLGIKRILLLTGDNQRTADFVGRSVGITEIYAGLMPEEKIDHVRQLLQEERSVAMVGDGINDAPALAAASVGIAMGVAGTDVAIETADVALMSDDLGKISEAIRIGRRTLRTIQMNIAFALSLKAVFLGLAIAGFSSLWMAVAADMGASLLVVVNSLSLLRLRPVSYVQG